MNDLKTTLDSLVERFEQPAFIADDPVSIPHAFDDPADREIIGLFAAVLAWGRRDVVLRNMAELTERMNHQPARFVRDFSIGRDSDRLDGFCHRTFHSGDAVGLTVAIQAVLRLHGSLGSLFGAHLPADSPDIGPAIQGFSETLCTVVPDVPIRSKHLARPSTGSACKRLAMYARWMTRPGPVDLGLWSHVRTSQLVLPLDVHTGRQARQLGLLGRQSDDWRAVQELTAACRQFSPSDPARYDYALFGRGVYGSKAFGVTEESAPTLRYDRL